MDDGITISYRRKANKLKEVTDMDWEKVNIDNRMLMEEYFMMCGDLSNGTKKQYRSCLRIFFNWMRIHSGNKHFYKMTKRDFIRYLVYLKENGLTRSAIKLKKSAVSGLATYIEKFVAEEDERYKNFSNFTLGVTSDLKSVPIEKRYVSKLEYQSIMDYLLKEKYYMEMAWVSLMFSTGCRSTEIIQLTVDLLDIPYEIDEHGRELDYKLTPYITGKAKGREGVPVRFAINRECMFHIERWLKSRRNKSEWIFATKYKKKYRQMSDTWGNYFCTRVISPIIKRNITPLSFKPDVKAVLNDFPEDRLIKVKKKKVEKK